VGKVWKAVEDGGLPEHFPNSTEASVAVEKGDVPAEATRLITARRDKQTALRVGTPECSTTEDVLRGRTVEEKKGLPIEETRSPSATAGLLRGRLQHH
jgi:hypothetical protein